MRTMRTETSTFGSPGRFGHDSSQFYAGRLFEGMVTNSKVEYMENPLPDEIINCIFRHNRIIDSMKNQEIG